MRAEMERMASASTSWKASLRRPRRAPLPPRQPPAKRRLPLPKRRRRPQSQASWKGAPEFKGEGGWSFKPRGRLQLDAGYVSRPEGITDKSTGFGSEVRRAYIGFDGTLPGGFGYRAEIDVAGAAASMSPIST